MDSIMVRGVVPLVFAVATMLFGTMQSDKKTEQVKSDIVAIERSTVAPTDPTVVPVAEQAASVQSDPAIKELAAMASTLKDSMARLSDMQTKLVSSMQEKPKLGDADCGDDCLACLKRVDDLEKRMTAMENRCKCGLTSATASTIPSQINGVPVITNGGGGVVSGGGSTGSVKQSLPTVSAYGAGSSSYATETVYEYPAVSTTYQTYQAQSRPQTCRNVRIGGRLMRVCN